MSTTTQIFKFAAKQIGITALQVITQKAGVELGNIAVEKGTEQIKKHVLKEPEQPVVQQQQEPIKTGHTGADIALNVLMSEVAKFKSKKQEQVQPQATVNETIANDTAPEISITEKAESVGSVVAEKTEQTVSVAKQIGAGFMKGFKK